MEGVRVLHQVAASSVVGSRRPPRPKPWRAAPCLSSCGHRLRSCADLGSSLEFCPALSQQFPNLRNPRRRDAEHFGGRAGRLARGESQGDSPQTGRQPAQPFREVDPAAREHNFIDSLTRRLKDGLDRARSARQQAVTAGQAKSAAKKLESTIPSNVPAPPIESMPTGTRVMWRKWSRSAPTRGPSTPATNATGGR